MKSYKFKIIIISLFSIILFASHKLYIEKWFTHGFNFSELNTYIFNSDDEGKDKFLLSLISQSLSAYHFNPLKIDDKFSEQVFVSYIETLDRNKRYFYKSDIEYLEKYKSEIDDQIKLGSYTFLNEVEKIYNKRYGKVEDYFQSALKQPFKLNKRERIEFDVEKIDYAKNEKEIRDKWRKYLKYQVVSRLYSKLKQHKEAKERNDTTFDYKTKGEYEKEIRKEILKTHNDWFHRMTRLEKSDRIASFLNVIANTYDPHTSYLPPEDKENFDIRMSGQFEGIGATLQESEGYIKVVNIVPGSACWRQGDLEVSDLIYKVAQADEEPVSIVDMRLDKAVKMIRGKKGTEVRLTVKKKNGEMMIIPIVRDVVILEETYAKSAVLEDKENKTRVGYIFLPRFYVNFNDDKGRRCSDDVRKEIEKLNQENIDGIVLDLRNNGGGSLPDVVKMGGLFIEKGPIVQVKTRSKKPEILKDKDSEIHYDGPLVVMVNSLSASASEIMAAAMQDYHRAIIVGTPSTYGKGTVQRFLNFDEMLPDKYNSMKPLGSIMMTIQKFYRINGGATQLKGVIPDIVIPDIYSYIDIGEKELDNAIKWDEIDNAKYKQCTKWDAKFKTAIENSKNRIANDTIFKLYDENARRFKKQTDISNYPLKLKDYTNYQDEVKAEAKKYEEIKIDSVGIYIFSSQDELIAIQNDTIKTERIKNWHKKLVKDKYLKETVNIINDLK